jgi:hypothetical protein
MTDHCNRHTETNADCELCQVFFGICNSPKSGVVSDETRRQFFENEKKDES